MGQSAPNVQEADRHVVQDEAHGPMQTRRLVPQELVAQEPDLGDARGQPQHDVTTPPVETRDHATQSQKQQEVRRQTPAHVPTRSRHWVGVLMLVRLALLFATVLALQGGVILEHRQVERGQRACPRRVRAHTREQHAHTEAQVRESVKEEHRGREDHQRHRTLSRTTLSSTRAFIRV